MFYKENSIVRKILDGLQTPIWQIKPITKPIIKNKIFIINGEGVLEKMADALEIDISKVDISKIAGFDSDGIIYNDIVSIIKLADKLLEKENENGA